MVMIHISHNSTCDHLGDLLSISEEADNLIYLCTGLMQKGLTGIFLLRRCISLWKSTEHLCKYSLFVLISSITVNVLTKEFNMSLRKVHLLYICPVNLGYGYNSILETYISEILYTDLLCISLKNINEKLTTNSDYTL